MVVDVPDERRDAVRDEHPHRLRAVHAGADHGVRGRLGAAERVGGEHARRGRPQRRHGRRVEHGEQPAVLGVREQHEPGHGRQPSRGLPGNDVTHLSSACPSPIAGIARKSPAG